MNEETLKTLSLRSFLVFLFGTSGFLVAIVMNASVFYIETNSVDGYEFLVRTQILAIKYIPFYLLVTVLFAGLALFLLYSWE